MTSPETVTRCASVEWYTPAHVIEAARATMGAIELDPASSLEANEVVLAKRFYSAADDGLTSPWKAKTVWLNPPYGYVDLDRHRKSSQEVWAAKLRFHYQQNDVGVAILLVNAAIGSKWFQPLWDFMICFPYRRLQFESSSGHTLSPPHGNAIVLFASQQANHARIRYRFRHYFSEIGRIVSPEAL